MTGRGPHLFTVPFSSSFLDVLGDVLLAETAHDPLLLASYDIFLPTRRAIKSLEAKLLQKRKNLFLPRFFPLGDLSDEDLAMRAFLESDVKEDVSSLKPLSKTDGLLMLTHLITGFSKTHKGAEHLKDIHLALRLAHDLWRLLNLCETEEVQAFLFERFQVEDLASHWQVSLSFLEMLFDMWPRSVEKAGALMPSTLRRLYAERLLAYFKETKPTHPIIVAGSTGSIPASARLMAYVATLRNGRTILPGFEKETAPDVAAFHPQYTMQQFLKKFHFSSEEVMPLVDSANSSFFSCIFSSEPLKKEHLPMGKIEGSVSLNSHEEAEKIALAIRYFLGESKKHVLFVTPDSSLRRRVRYLLEKWQIIANDAGGEPFSGTPFGSLLLMSAEVLFGKDSVSSFLGLLKHPLVTFSKDKMRLHTLVRLLEKRVLRQPQKVRFSKLAEFIKENQKQDGLLADEWIEIIGLLETYETFLSCPSGSKKNTFQSCFKKHKTFLTFCIGDFEALWENLDEDIQRFWHELEASSYKKMSRLEESAYPLFLNALMRGLLVRSPRADAHARLEMVGALEARLLSADVVILGGLVEGTWPQEFSFDPWFNGSMRRHMGLSPLEQRLGLSMHDFLQGIGAPHVILSRSEREAGVPTIPSRFWTTLELALKRTDQPLQKATWLDEAHQEAFLPETVLMPSLRPSPTPPLSFRPNTWSVTEVGYLLRDPYTIYASRILKLKPLPQIDEDTSLQAFGIAVHKMLQTSLFKEHPTKEKDAACQKKDLAVFEKEFLKYSDKEHTLSYWHLMAERILTWFYEKERGQALTILSNRAECSKSLQIKVGPREHSLKGRLDRVILFKDGTFSVIDYKTGQLPSLRDMHKGFFPQLQLEAALLLFSHEKEDASFNALRSLEYWQLKGRGEGGLIVTFDESPEVMVRDAVEGFQKLLSYFSKEEHGYLSLPFGAVLRTPYAHLARVDEWMTRGDI